MLYKTGILLALNMLLGITKMLHLKLPEKKIVSLREGNSNMERLILLLGADYIFGSNNYTIIKGKNSLLK